VATKLFQDGYDQLSEKIGQLKRFERHSPTLLFIGKPVS
jgi:hypothetical protein